MFPETLVGAFKSLSAPPLYLTSPGSYRLGSSNMYSCNPGGPWRQTIAESALCLCTASIHRNTGRKYHHNGLARGRGLSTSLRVRSLCIKLAAAFHSQFDRIGPLESKMRTQPEDLLTRVRVPELSLEKLATRSVEAAEVRDGSGIVTGKRRVRGTSLKCSSGCRAQENLC